MDKFTLFDLRVYKEAKQLVREIYSLLDTFPKFETYALSDQLRRAVVSIPSNIAEGSGRESIKEKIHFLEIAFGSLMEAFSQLQNAQDLEYIKQQKVEDIRPQFEEAAKMISGLKASLEKKL